MDKILPKPNITAKDAQGQIEQVLSYLYQLTEQLEFIFDALEYEIEKKGASNEN